jgi:hypothetical protein
MAVLAVDLERARMDDVAEEDRLHGPLALLRHGQHALGVEGRIGEGADVGDHVVDLLVGERGLERRHQVREPDGLRALADRAHEHVVGQRVHDAAVGEVLRLDGEVRAARPIAFAGVAVTGHAVLDVDLLAPGDVRIRLLVRRLRIDLLRLGGGILGPAEESDEDSRGEDGDREHESADAHGADCTLFHPPR